MYQNLLWPKSNVINYGSCTSVYAVPCKVQRADAVLRSVVSVCACRSGVGGRNSNINSLSVPFSWLLKSISFCRDEDNKQLINIPSYACWFSIVFHQALIFVIWFRLIAAVIVVDLKSPEAFDYVDWRCPSEMLPSFQNTTSLIGPGAGVTLRFSGRDQR